MAKASAFAPKPAPAASPVRDVLVREIRRAISEVAPSLPPMQRVLVQTAAGAAGGMSEDMARGLAAELVKLAAELRPLLGEGA